MPHCYARHTRKGEGEPSLGALAREMWKVMGEAGAVAESAGASGSRGEAEAGGGGGGPSSGSSTSGVMGRNQSGSSSSSFSALLGVVFRRRRDSGGGRRLRKEEGGGREGREGMGTGGGGGGRVELGVGVGGGVGDGDDVELLLGGVPARLGLGVEVDRAILVVQVELGLPLLVLHVLVQLLEIGRECRPVLYVRLGPATQLWPHSEERGVNRREYQMETTPLETEQIRGRAGCHWRSTRISPLVPFKILTKLPLFFSQMYRECALELPEFGGC